MQVTGESLARNLTPRSRLRAITGTPRYAALSVLEGSEHTVSSMLEGLFISILDVSCNFRLTGRHQMASVTWTAALRRGTLLAKTLMESHAIQSPLRAFVHALHELFYPLPGGARVRGYRTDVTVEEVQSVCSTCGPLSWTTSHSFTRCAVTSFYQPFLTQ